MLARSNSRCDRRGAGACADRVGPMLRARRGCRAGFVRERPVRDEQLRRCGGGVGDNTAVSDVHAKVASARLCRRRACVPRPCRSGSGRRVAARIRAYQIQPNVTK